MRSNLTSGCAKKSLVALRLDLLLNVICVSLPSRMVLKKLNEFLFRMVAAKSPICRALCCPRRLCSFSASCGALRFQMCPSLPMWLSPLGRPCVLQTSLKWESRRGRTQRRPPWRCVSQRWFAITDGIIRRFVGNRAARGLSSMTTWCATLGHRGGPWCIAVFAAVTSPFCCCTPTRPALLWRPLRAWGPRFACPWSSCGEKQVS